MPWQIKNERRSKQGNIILVEQNEKGETRTIVQKIKLNPFQQAVRDALAKNYAEARNFLMLAMKRKGENGPLAVKERAKSLRKQLNAFRQPHK